MKSQKYRVFAWAGMITCITLLTSVRAVLAQTELVTNGGFEAGSTGWVLSGNFYADSRFPNSHSGVGYAYVSNPDGTSGSNLVGSMYQSITIPANATSATLTFWYNITSQETGPTANDVLNITIQNSTGGFLATVAVYSNLNKDPAAGNPHYHQKSFDMTPYKGQTVRVHFLGTTNSSLPTTFRIDDVSVVAVLPAPLAPTVAWVTPPPSPLTSGQTFSASWKITGGGSVSHTNIHWDTIDPTNPDRCNPNNNPPCSNNAQKGSPGTYSDNGMVAPTVSSATVYKYVAHAIVDGVDYWSQISSITVNPSLTTGPIRLRAPWDEGYWFAQTYDKHLRLDGKWEDSARRAVDFYWASPQEPHARDRWPEGGRGKAVVAAHSGKVSIGSKYKLVDDQCVQHPDGHPSLRITSPDGYTTEYIHLDFDSAIAGRTVATGEVIGRVAALGCTNTPHLMIVVYRGELTSANALPLDDPNQILLDGEVIFASGERIQVRGPTDAHGQIYDYTALPRQPTAQPQPVLSLTPTNRDVAATGGSTTFNVANTGSGTMTYTASVTDGSSWLSITSGGAGGNSGTITATYTANPGPQQRVGKITVTAPGATESPKSITVTQAASEQKVPPITLSVEPKSQTVSLNSTFTINIVAKESTNLAGFELDLTFNPAVLEAVAVTEGVFLKSDGGNTNFTPPKLDNAAGLISGIVNVRTSPGGGKGSGTLVTVNLKAKGKGNSSITFQKALLSDPSAQAIPHLLENSTIAVTAFSPWDVNQDGVVNVLDFVIVGQNFRKPNFDPRADVNGDGEVNVLDFVLIGQHFRETTVAATPAIALGNLSPEQVAVLERMYQIMDELPNSDPEFIRTKAMLRELLSLAPKPITHSRVLQNYPNPFNPETWIPYQLAEPAFVTLRIFDIRGRMVRTIEAGYQEAGAYITRQRAVYWDGRNDFGERVSSGVYLYQLQVRNQTFTRRMAVLK